MDMRLLPVRCWSCNQPVQKAWDEFRLGARRGLDQAALLDSLNLGSRYCCRRMLLTQPVPLALEVLEPPAAPEAEPKKRKKARGA